MADTTHEMQVRTTVKDLASRKLRGLGKTGNMAGKSIAAGFIKAQLAIGALKVAVRAAIRSVRSITTEFGETADRTAKLARQLGVSTEALSEYGHIAEFAGTNLEAVGKSVRFVQRSLAEAQRGTLTYTEQFEKLGLTAEDVNRLMAKDGVDAFEAIGMAIAGLDTHAEKVNASMVLLGRSGTEMIPVFEQGTEAIRAQRKELKVFGVTLTETQGRVAEEFQDARKRFNMAMEGIKKGVAEKLLPVLTKALNFLATWVAKNRERVVDFFLDLADAFAALAENSVYAAQAAIRALTIIAEGSTKAMKNNDDILGGLIGKIKEARKLLADLRKNGLPGLDGAGGGAAEDAKPRGEILTTATRSFMDKFIFGELSDTGELLGGIRESVTKIREQLKPENLGMTTVNMLTNAWAGFFDAITFGAQKAEDAFKNMALSMLRQMAQLANQAFFSELLGAVAGLGGPTPTNSTPGASVGGPLGGLSSSGLRSALRGGAQGGLVP